MSEATRSIKISCSPYDRDRMRAADREIKQLSRKYLGRFSGDINIDTQLAEYRLSYPVSELLSVWRRIQRRRSIGL